MMTPSCGSGVSAERRQALDGPGVDPGAVAVATAEDDRPVGDDRIERRLGGIAAREDRHVPAIAMDARLVGGGLRHRPRPPPGRCAGSSWPARRSQRPSPSPPLVTWTCASPKPGSTVRPCRSTTRVAGPMSRRRDARRTDGCDASPADGDRVGDRARRVDGVDGAAGQDDIGRAVVRDGGRPQGGAF